MRWCTRMLKIKPFEKYVGDDPVLMYVGIRADEDRTAYVSSKPNITAVYPFRDEGIAIDDVQRILEESGIGLPSYYDWRTRSGCYFCFFQRKAEWVGLLEHHPDLFEEAKRYEKIDPQTGERYTWNQRESLEELAAPARITEIEERHQKAIDQKKQRRANAPLLEVLKGAIPKCRYAAVRLECFFVDGCVDISSPSSSAFNSARHAGGSQRHSVFRSLAIASRV